MTEETVGNVLPCVNVKIPVLVLRGIPMGMLSRSKDVREFLGIDDETWDMWKHSDPPLAVAELGTNAELVLTNNLHAFAASNPKLAERRSAVRKRELAELQKKRRAKK